MHNTLAYSDKSTVTKQHQVITTQLLALESWAGMEAEWQDLLIYAHCDVLFLQHAWLSAWWEVFGKLNQARLYIVTARDHHQRLIGALPLYLKSERYLGLPATRLYLLGHGQSDVNDVPCANIEAAKALVDYLVRHAKEWDALVLGEIDPHGCFTRVAQATFSQTFKHSIQDDSNCAWLPVEGDWTNFYESRFSGQKRKKLRSEWRNLENAYPISIRLIHDIHQEPDILERLAEIEHAHPNAGSSRPGSLNDPALGKFLRTIVPILNQKQSLTIAVLRCDDCDSAYQLWFHHQGRYCGYAMSYRAELASFGVGKLLLLHSLEAHWNADAKVIDFLRGSEEYKRQLATESRQNLKLSFTSPSLSGRWQHCLWSVIGPWLATTLPAIHQRLLLADQFGWRCALGLRAAPHDHKILSTETHDK